MTLLTILIVALTSQATWPPIVDGEREILLELYEKTGGDGWTNNQYWGSDRSPCDWHGITCDETLDDQLRRRSTVESIWLRMNGLKGELSESLTQLRALRGLDVGHNQLAGMVSPMLLARFDRGDLDLRMDGNAFPAHRQCVRLQGATVKWVERIRSLFSKTGRHTATPEAVRRVPAAANPYGVDLWDCAAFTQSMVSTTSDPRVAATFARLRASVGSEYRDQCPVNASVTDCALAYPVAQSFGDGPLFKANAMEDKWDVYFFNPHIYFARSWTGQLLYRATVRFEDQRMVITRIESAGGHESESGRPTVDYLVKSHVLGAVAAHPLPGDLPADPMQIAASSFAVFGRRCAHGTYADTTVLPWTTASGQREGPSAL